jgi:hypothetical protein
VNTVANTYMNYKAIIGHSGVEILETTSANNFIDQTTVIDGTVMVPAGHLIGDWITLPLTTPFEYDGKQNLAVWLGTTAASGVVSSTQCKVSSADAARYPSQIATGSPDAVTLASPVNNKMDMQFVISR